jgi:hypothetical protein
MNEQLALAYARASAALLELPLDGDQAERVAVYLARTANMARMLDAIPLDPADEPAGLYCPAPFPDTLP